MPYGFETVVECLRNAKMTTIEQGVHIGKNHPILKYPLFAIMVVFIFAYNFFLHLCIQMHQHKSFSKGLAYVLIVALVVSNVSVTAFADDNETVPEKITAFSELPSDIAQQTIFIGDDESKITFPSSLGVTIERTEVITTKTKIEETIEEKDAIDNEDSEQIKNEEQDPLAKELTEEESVSEGSSSDSEEDAEEINAEQDATEISSSDISNESAQEIETENESVEDATEANKQSEESEEDNSSAEETTPDDQAMGIFNIILPSITVYAAEPDAISEEVDSEAEEDAEYEISKETVTSSEETFIEGITWSLDVESSSAEEFSSEVAGTQFVYVPVISGDYNIASDLPKITVNVVEKEENVESVSFSHSESVAGYNISIDAPAGVFPEDTTVSINIVSNPVTLIEGELSDGRNIQQIITFDISFWHDGVEIEPEDGSVHVSISLASDMKETLQDESAEVQVFHIDDTRNIEEVACSTNGEEVCFSADEFSEYAVVTSTGILDIEAPTLQNIFLETSSVTAPGRIEITVEATDDISGIRYMNVDFYNETYKVSVGASLSYNKYEIYHDGEWYRKEFNDGKWHGIIFVDQYGRPGEYKLRWVDLTDNASNSRSYTPTSRTDPLPESLSSLSLTIEDNPSLDIEAPTLQNIFLETSSVTAPGRIEITVEATDDISGIRYMNVDFYNETYKVSVGASLSYNKYEIYHDGEWYRKEFNDGKWHGIIFVDQYGRPGEYKLRWVDLTDNASNSRSYTPTSRTDPLPESLSSLILTIEDNPSLDIEAPTLQNIFLETSSATAPGRMEITVEATDDISGIRYMNVDFYNETYKVSVGASLSYNKYEIYHDGEWYRKEFNDGKWHGIIFVDQYGRPGEYKLRWVDLTDNASNSRSYTPTSRTDPLPESLRSMNLIIYNAGSGASLISNTSDGNLADKIRNEEDDALILVDYSNNSSITSDVFDAIKGTDQTLVLESEGIQWVFDGSEISNESKNVNLSVNVQYVNQMPSGTDRAAITGTVNDQPTVVLTFPENGTLPGTATMRVKADYAMRQYLGQSGIYVYYVDNANGRMVPIAENITITADNYIEFDIDHCSKYIVVKGKLESLDITPDQGSSGENSSGGGSSSSGENSSNGGNSSGGGSSSSSNSASNSTSRLTNSSTGGDSSSSEKAAEWTPKTPDEVKRYSVVGKEVLSPFVDKSSGYTLTMKNAMQGPSCFTAFESVLNGYTIGRTYDIFPNGQRVQSTDKEVGFSIEVPKTLQKEGRTFQMICVTKGGQPIVLKDLDSNPNTITVKTNKFYAFALVYKDPVTTK